MRHNDRQIRNLNIMWLVIFALCFAAIRCFGNPVDWGDEAAYPADSPTGGP